MYPKGTIGNFKMWNVTKSGAKVALMILGLTGMVDDIVIWHGFLSSIVSEYQNIRDFLFGILPIHFPDTFKDYFVVGLVISASLFRSISPGEQTEKGEIPWKIVVFVGVTLTWPGILLVITWEFLDSLLPIEDFLNAIKGKGRESYVSSISGELKFFRDLAWTAVLFIVALFLFSDALTSFTGG